MTSPLPRTVFKVYLLSALIAPIMLSPLPYSAIALVLFVLHNYTAFRPPRADLNLVLVFSTLLLLPLTLQASAAESLSTLVVIPAIPLLDYSLRGNAPNQAFHQTQGRRFTNTLKALGTALLVVLVVSLLLGNRTLTFTVVLLAAYVGGMVAYTLYGIPGMPLHASTSRVRVIAGNRAETAVGITNRARISLHTQITSSHPWVNINPSHFRLGKDEVVLNMSLTPPLSGPSSPEFQALMIDPWGLVQVSQSLRPVELYVIPRARYAEWLARRFLSQASLQGASASVTIAPGMAPRAAGWGVEYVSSRLYEPGDSLRDIDWKRSAKLNRLVVKEYTEAENTVTVVAANLTAENPEEADGLAYDLITLALTLARAAAPVALAIYNHQEVLLTTRAADPRDVLKKVLKVAQKIAVLEQQQRFLQPPDIRRLRRNMAQLGHVGTDSSQRLAALLGVEYMVLGQVARDHPAARAITAAAEQVLPPATIAVVSGWNHDAEALLITLDRLERQGYHTVSLEIAGRR